MKIDIPQIGVGLVMAICAVTQKLAAQPYSIDWHKITGGSGTSTNGPYSVCGTIGQPDAGGAMTGGGYALTSGFWSLLTAAQSAGVPDLIIVPNGLNSVTIIWPATGVGTLQQNSNLAGGSWTTSGCSITTANGTNSITITPPFENLFFRLEKPLRRRPGT